MQPVRRESSRRWNAIRTDTLGGGEKIILLRDDLADTYGYLTLGANRAAVDRLDDVPKRLRIPGAPEAKDARRR